jgi:probable F420-dependent oxidoreductase
MSDQALPAIAAPARPAPLLSVALVNFRSHDPADWRFLVERAVAAEQAGVDGVVVSDHVVMGEHLEAYGRPELGGMDGGRQPTGPDGHWLEPLTSLGVIAGATSAVRLGTGILLAALRRPAVLAKTAATLDVLSGGRLDLGVGVGWQREEYEAAGLDFGRRGRLLDHTLEVCQRLWLDRCAAYDAPELRFRDIHAMPKPVAPTGVPIWVSGTLNDRVLDRLARFGTGWIPWGRSAAQLATSIPQLRDGVAARGRDPEGLGVVGAVVVVPDAAGVIEAGPAMAAVPGLVAAGVTDVRLHLPLPDRRAEVLDVLAPLVAEFRDLVGRAEAVRS